ncbi:hypothetical protein BP6252_13915 [Coleophoma cylindrospora]|uniref:Cytochrome P450 n=1 Tax=Coleophoma cylindrospora TaxID=1849047 RepID=A0A3D8Q5F7_9HELO|nr:hypothetical protein BP6252_13915 [Coleophoma cylindrospora]
MAAVDHDGPDSILAMIGVLFTVVAILVIAIQHYVYFPTKLDSGRVEPPLLPSSIPVVGHLINLLIYGKQYFMTLEQQHHQSLYALPMWPILNSRMYLITSPDWVNAMKPTHKSLSFYTLIVRALKIVFKLDETTINIIERNVDGRTRGRGENLFQETHDMMHATLAPGRHLDDLSLSMLNNMASTVNGLAPNKGESQVIGLWSWIRHHFTLASATAVYGPHNPFSKNPDLIADFWTLDENLISLMLLPWTWLTARRGYLARRRVFDGFVEYAEKGHYADASQLIRSRVALNSRYGVAKRMDGQLESSMAFGLLANTIPASFWMLSYILADPKLLAALRVEIGQCVRVEEREQDQEGEDDCGGKKTKLKTKHIINATKLKTHCPLLASTFRETLRVTASVIVNRWILDDVEVMNQVTGKAFVLRKGSLVQTATHVIHADRSVYGDDADLFDARRFMSTVGYRHDGEERTKILDPAGPFRDIEGNVHHGSFRPFGSGKHICPGR